MVTAKEFRQLQRNNDCTRRWKKWIEEELMDLVSPNTTRRTDLESWDFNFGDSSEELMVVEKVIVPWLKGLGFRTEIGEFTTYSEPDKKRHYLRVRW